MQQRCGVRTIHVFYSYLVRIIRKSYVRAPRMSATSFNPARARVRACVTCSAVPHRASPDSVHVSQVIHLFQVAVQALECPSQRAFRLQRDLPREALPACPPRVQPQHRQHVVDLALDAQHRVCVHRGGHPPTRHRQQGRELESTAVCCLVWLPFRSRWGSSL